MAEWQDSRRQDGRTAGCQDGRRAGAGLQDGMQDGRTAGRMAGRQDSGTVGWQDGQVWRHGGIVRRQQDGRMVGLGRQMAGSQDGRRWDIRTAGGKEGRMQDGRIAGWQEGSIAERYNRENGFG
jgi:hypothetical protein